MECLYGMGRMGEKVPGASSKITREELAKAAAKM